MTCCLYRTLPPDFVCNYIWKKSISPFNCLESIFRLPDASASILIVAFSFSIEAVVSCADAAFSCEIADSFEITATTCVSERLHEPALPRITSVHSRDTVMPSLTSAKRCLVALMLMIH